MNSEAVLADYVRSLADFVIVETIDGNYNHMGATIADAVLQAGISYDAVVRPRVRRILVEHPEARTASQFLRLLEDRGVEAVLAWSAGRKLGTALGLTRFLVQEGVETEDDLRRWLQESANHARLRAIHGIGPKTVDYLHILIGMQAVAVDVHIRRFLARAQLPVRSYGEARDLVCGAADLLGIEQARFDHSIWKYMSGTP